MFFQGCRTVPAILNLSYSQSLGFVRFCALIRAVAEFLSRLARIPFRRQEVPADNDTLGTQADPSGLALQQLTRSHSSAFPDSEEVEDGGVAGGKRVRLDGGEECSIADSKCASSDDADTVLVSKFLSISHPFLQLTPFCYVEAAFGHHTRKPIWERERQGKR